MNTRPWVKAKANYFFIVWAVGRIVSGRSVGKIIIIILSFWVSTSKNKNIDHRVKETYVIFGLSIQNRTLPLFDLFVLKERACIRTKRNSWRKVFTWEINIIIIFIWRKLGFVGPVQQKIKLPSPNMIGSKTWT